MDLLGGRIAAESPGVGVGGWCCLLLCMPGHPSYPPRGPPGRLGPLGWVALISRSPKGTKVSRTFHVIPEGTSRLPPHKGHNFGDLSPH